MAWHETRVRVRFNEADPWGIVWYPNYFAYVEEAKCGLLALYDLRPEALTALGYTAPLIESTCTYKSSARFNDELLVRVAVVPQEAAKLVFRFELRQADDGRLVAQGQTAQVLVSAQTGLIYHLTGPVAERIMALTARHSLPAGNETTVERVCVIVPAYNAGRTLGPLLDQLLAQGPEIVVVDDGSQDDTAAVASAYAHRGVELLRHQRNQGKGAALRRGFRRAVARGCTVAVTLDSDLQHDPADLPGLLQTFREQQLDLLIGSRLHEAQRMPPSRRFGNRFSSWIASQFCGQRILDSQCGYRLFRLTTCGGFVCTLAANRFTVESEALLQAASRGLRIGFSPIHAHYPTDANHRSYFRAWRDTLSIIRMYAVELVRRTARRLSGRS